MNSIKLFPSINELTKLNEFIHNELSIYDSNVDLIVEEIFVNIVNYSKCTYINVNIGLTDESILKIEFVDDGFKFNPIERDSPDYPTSIDEAEIGGLGIHLVKNLADEFYYYYENNENHLTVIKNVKAWRTKLEIS